MLVYRKQSMQMQEFFQSMQYLAATYSIDIPAGDFSYVLLKVLENKLLNIFTDHVQIVNKPIHISGSLIDHIYITISSMEEFFINATAENIYFSDHDAVRVKMEKMLLIFKIFHKIQYAKARKNNLLVF